MPLFIFWCEADKAVRLHGDVTDNNLPVDLAPWSRDGTGEASRMGGESITALATANPVIQAVERDGFYIGRTAATVTCTRWPD
jgi:hypothetical protein